MIYFYLLHTFIPQLAHVHLDEIIEDEYKKRVDKNHHNHNVCVSNL